MASMEKYSDMAIIERIIGHNNRTNKHNSNTDIDVERTKNNIVIKTMNKQQYRAKLKDYYIYGNRPDTVKLCEIVITEPKDITQYFKEYARDDIGYYIHNRDKKIKTVEDLVDHQRKELFEKINNFLEEKYGVENTVSSVIHMDESGQPHLHFCFIPAIKEQKSKRNPEIVNKICCKKVWNKQHFQNFHSDLRDYLNKNTFADLGDSFYTGITKKNGGNRTVEQLKQQTRERNLERENQQLRAKINELEKERDTSHSRSRWEEPESTRKINRDRDIEIEWY